MKDANGAYFLLTNRYVIISGEVNVIVDMKIVNTMGPGTGFGEMALNGKGKRTATIITKCPQCILICIDKVDYNRIMKHAYKRERYFARLNKRPKNGEETIDSQDTGCVTTSRHRNGKDLHAFDS